MRKYLTCIIWPSAIVASVVKIRSWTRRLREIRAVGGPEVGWVGRTVGGGRLGVGRTLGVFNYKFVVV